MSFVEHIFIYQSVIQLREILFEKSKLILFFFRVIFHEYKLFINFKNIEIFSGCSLQYKIN